METVLSAKEYIPGLVFYLTAMEKRVELYKVDGECDDGWSSRGNTHCRSVEVET